MGKVMPFLPGEMQMSFGKKGQLIFSIEACNGSSLIWGFKLLDFLAFANLKL